jgi:hypothetical protein
MERETLSGSSAVRCLTGRKETAQGAVGTRRRASGGAKRPQGRAPKERRSRGKERARPAFNVPQTSPVPARRRLVAIAPQFARGIVTVRPRRGRRLGEQSE